jgi:hypothetical protein
MEQNQSPLATGKSKSVVQFLTDRNKEQTKTYTGSDAVLWRRQYRAKYPTEIAALKCMDGRLNLALMTETPPGIIQPFRNIGGKFDLGWPFFGVLMREWVEYALSRGRDCIVTYHYSKGDTHRGCKGFGYDTAAANAAAEALRGKFEDVFGSSHQIVYPIVVGIETDGDALVLHGTNGEKFDMFENVDMNEDDLMQKLGALYPDMRERFRRDLVPLLVGNQRHIKKVQAENRTILDSEHREQILGIGRGFDWLHLPNKALLVGPYSYDLRTPISTAASILLDNLKSGRIPKDEGVVIMTSAVYRSHGPERLLAIEKARSLATFALDAISKDVPELMPYLVPLVGTVDLHTRAFEPLA